MLRALGLGGYLHDLGKIAVPDRILLKAGPLEQDEWTEMRVHAVKGSELVVGLRSLDAVRPIMRHHHERWDGSGYPDGLKGEAIPLGARIISVVDVYDALHTNAPVPARAFPRRGGHDPAAGNRGRLLGPARGRRRSSTCSGTSPTIRSDAVPTGRRRRQDSGGGQRCRRVHRAVRVASEVVFSPCARPASRVRSRNGTEDG